MSKNYRIFRVDSWDGSKEHVATVKPELVDETLAHYNDAREIDLDGNPTCTYVAEGYDGFVQGQA